MQTNLLKLVSEQTKEQAFSAMRCGYYLTLEPNAHFQNRHPTYRPSTALDPAEWDFSSLPPELFDAFLEYEYARSSPRVVAEANRFLSVTVKGKSVRELFHEFDEKDWSEANKITSQFEVNFVLKVFLWNHPAFPEPWLSHRLQPSRNHELQQESPLHIYPVIRGGDGFRIVEALLSPGQYSDERNELLKKNWFVAQIDWERASKSQLMQAFSNWVDARKTLLGVKRGRGGMAEPLHKLKALSALRLSEHGMSFDMAKSFLQSKRTRTRTTFAWPDFENPPAWSRAKATARQEIARREIMLVGYSNNSKF